MNADGKLLQLAAKAAGYAVRYEGEYLTFFRADVVGSPIWDPLSDNSDALRLAVKLGIAFKYYRKAPHDFGLLRGCAVAVATLDDGRVFSESSTSRMSATRRAIVRAAAEIGRAMLLIEGGAA